MRKFQVSGGLLEVCTRVSCYIEVKTRRQKRNSLLLLVEMGLGLGLGLELEFWTANKTSRQESIIVPQHGDAAIAQQVHVYTATY